MKFSRKKNLLVLDVRHFVLVAESRRTNKTLCFASLVSHLLLLCKRLNTTIQLFELRSENLILLKLYSNQQ